MVNRIAFGKLCANVAEWRDHTGRAQRVRRSQDAIQYCRRDGAASGCLHEEIVGRVWPEEIGGYRRDYRLTRSVNTINSGNDRRKA